MWRRLVYGTSAAVRRRPTPHHAANHALHSGPSHSAQVINQNIIQETEISREHLTPEIALRLITPNCRLFNEPVTLEIENLFPHDPFWGFYWPGGQAISRYILDNPSVVSNKAILDVGSGCGASSLAAIKSKAKYAVANDIDEAAGYAALINAQINNLDVRKLHICVDNLIAQNADKVAEEVILLGDVFYNDEFAAVLLPWLQCLRDLGKQILIGDPGRHALPKERLELMRKMATYELTENCCIENKGFKFVHVWEYK